MAHRPTDADRPRRVAFVDGTLRTAARLTRTGPASDVNMGLAGCWAAGAVLVDGDEPARFDPLIAPSRSRPLGTCASKNQHERQNREVAPANPSTVVDERRTPAMRRSPRAGPCRPRHQTPRYACRFGSLASTSWVDAWTPCVASSVAIDAACVAAAPSAPESSLIDSFAPRPDRRSGSLDRGPP